MPGPTFGFVKLLASSGSHCTKWADEQHRQAGSESRLVPDLPLPFIPTLIGLRAFDLVSSRVWWEAATNTCADRTEPPNSLSLSLSPPHTPFIPIIHYFWQIPLTASRVCIRMRYVNSCWMVWLSLRVYKRIFLITSALLPHE